MFFRNLTLFRFPTSLDLSDLDTHLAECALKPVGPLELSSRGFVPPMPRKGEGDDAEAALSHRIGDAIWLSVGSEDRLLPSAVVNRRSWRTSSARKAGAPAGARASA